MQKTDLDDEQKEYVDIAATSRQRLTRLLNDILNVSKIESGKLEITESSFSIFETMQSIQDIFAHTVSSSFGNVSTEAFFIQIALQTQQAGAGS